MSESFSMPGSSATKKSLDQVEADLFLTLCNNANILLYVTVSLRLHPKPIIITSTLRLGNK